MSPRTVLKKETKLLHWLILVSLLIHIPIYLYMNGLLDTDMLHYIDLTIRKGEDSSSRKMLRPPLVSKNEGKSGKVRAILMTPAQIPDNTLRFTDNSVMDNSSSTGIGSGTGFSSSGSGGGGSIVTREDYIEMVRLKIERNTRFPPGDIQKRRGGVVTVQFVINLDGTIRDLKILKPSPIEGLNRQALHAVRDSAPFMKPPPYLYKEPVLYGPLDVNFIVY